MVILPRLRCSRNTGITPPRLHNVAITGTAKTRVLGPGVSIGLNEHLLRTELVAPYKLMDFTALSVLKARIRPTPWLMAASMTLRPP